MLNEKRVKHMVKLASYETNNGTEDMKISSYFRGDYISFNVLCSLIWATIGFVTIVGLLGIAYMDLILEELTIQGAIYLILAFIVLYILLMIVYGVIAYCFYKKKHLSARNKIKKFGRGLEALEKMYEKEKE